MKKPYQSVLCVLTLLLVSGCGGAPGATGATGSSGATGAQGPAGSNGSNGTNGTNGTSATLEHAVHCFASDNGSGTQLEFQYDSTTTSAGVMTVSCSVATAGQESSYTNPDGVVATGGCAVNLGVGASDFGFWEFTSESGTTKAVYSDVGSAHNGYTFTFPAADCSSF